MTTICVGNKARLDALKAGILDMFSGAARDIRGILNDPAYDQVLPDLWRPHPDLFEADKQALQAYIQCAQADPNRPKREAQYLRSEYSSAYSMCLSPERLSVEGGKLADCLIAQWGKAQILRVAPDLIDDEDIGVQGAIAQVFDRAGQRLSLYQNWRLNTGAEPQIINKVPAALAYTGEDPAAAAADVYARLDVAESVLGWVQTYMAREL